MIQVIAMGLTVDRPLLGQRREAARYRLRVSANSSNMSPVLAFRDT